MKALKFKALILNILFPLAAGISSCSVKEDRVPCPCYLTINFSRLPEKMLHPNAGLWIQVTQDDYGITRQETISPADYPAPDWYITGVPKGFAQSTALTGRQHWRTSADGTELMLSEGNEADSLYAHSQRIDCTGELARDTVLLHKQWCTLTIKLKGAELWADYSFEMDGRWAGIWLSDLSPSEGKFRCEPRRLDVDLYEVRIPRQGDNSLKLNMYDGDGKELVYDYPIGTLIYRAGYDWYRLDLDDVVVTVDYARAEVGVEIVPWDAGENFPDIEI